MEKLGLQGIGWRDGEDPPDFYLSIGNQEFAVEVTTLEHVLDTDSGREVRMLAYSGSVDTLVREIEAEAIKQGILNGTYDTSANGPFDAFGSLRKAIMDGALDYVRRTQNLPQADYEEIVSQGVRYFRIQKIKAEGARILPGLLSYGPGRSLVAWVESDDVRLEACRLLRKALLDKKEKLKNVPLPKILLLRNAYVFAGAHVYRQCIENLQDLLRSFHSVFTVESEGYFLSTEEDAWHQH